MDSDNRRDLTTVARSPEHRKKIRLLRDFDPSSAPSASVPDPYYGGEEDFEETYRVIESGVAGLLKTLQARRA